MAASAYMAGGEMSAKMWIIILVVLVLVITGILVAMKRRKTVRFVGGGQLRTLAPAGEGPHTHTVDLDEFGDGTSSEDWDHRHAVENAVDAGLAGGSRPADGHKHDLAAHVIDL